MKLIDKILKENMTEKGFKLWNGVKSILPDIWEKATSSTGKYHKKENGDVPDIAEHTFEMLYAASKIIRMFSIEKNTTMCDTIMLSLVLHDSLKYGKTGDMKHTYTKHDQLAGDMIKANESTFKKLLNNEEFNILSESARYHSGQWSTDVLNRSDFNFDNFSPYVLFVHMLDMLSTSDLIKIWTKDLKIEEE